MLSKVWLLQAYIKAKAGGGKVFWEKVLEHQEGYVENQ